MVDSIIIIVKKKKLNAFILHMRLAILLRSQHSLF